MKSALSDIIEEIKWFRDARDWEQFHDGKNPANSLSVEESELLERFLWKNDIDVDSNKVKLKLADVFYNAFLIVDLYEFNVKEIINKKLKINESKFPISRSKDSNKKYNEF